MLQTVKKPPGYFFEQHPHERPLCPRQTAESAENQIKSDHKLKYNLKGHVLKINFSTTVA
jgi:hypothetical protein